MLRSHRHTIVRLFFFAAGALRVAAFVVRRARPNENAAHSRSDVDDEARRRAHPEP